MKNLAFLSVVVLFLTACKGDKSNNMFVSGEIKGLKKGSLYLYKQVDTLQVAVDSIFLDGESFYELSDYIESPEIYYLSLNNDREKKIIFFGDEGTITINTKLDKFIQSAQIEGQKNQRLLAEYNQMIKKFRDKNLDLIKANFESKGDSLKLDSVLNESNSLVRRRYFYTTNFAVRNADAEIAPYLALTELYNANISLLDTINNSLTQEVKASKYGKELEKFISEIKARK